MKHYLQCLSTIGVLIVPPSTHALLASCSVAAASISFGNYASPGNTDSDNTGNVAVTCSAVVAGVGNYTITLSTGSGSYTNRKLISGGNFLNYNVYSDATRLQIWGDGSGGTSTVTDSYFILVTPTVRNYTAYGRIPGNQNKPAGTYSDALTITVTY